MILNTFILMAGVVAVTMVIAKTALSNDAEKSVRGMGLCAAYDE